MREPGVPLFVGEVGCGEGVASRDEDAKSLSFLDEVDRGEVLVGRCESAGCFSLCWFRNHVDSS